jgi:hypothetical protein
MADLPREDFFNDIANTETLLQVPDGDRTKISHLYQRYRTLRDNPHRQEALEWWNDGDKAYSGYIPPLAEDDPRTNLNVDPSFAIVETINQETMERNARPYYEPFEKSDKSVVHLINEVARSSFEIGNFDREYALMKKERDIRGTSILLEIYREERRWVKELSSG